MLVIFRTPLNKKRIFVICRLQNGPVVIASPAGGTDIETVAEKTPDLIKTYPIDIYDGITDGIAADIAKFLKFDGKLQKKVIIYYISNQSHRHTHSFNNENAY